MDINGGHSNYSRARAITSRALRKGTTTLRSSTTMLKSSTSIRRSCSSRSRFLAALGLLLLCSSFFVAASAKDSLQTSLQPRQLQNTEASDEGIIDEKDEAMAMQALAESLAAEVSLSLLNQAW